jgi:hypothetical protein
MVNRSTSENKQVYRDSRRRQRERSPDMPQYFSLRGQRRLSFMDEPGVAPVAIIAAADAAPGKSQTKQEK